MLPEQIKNFREVVTLRDGVYVLLRPIVKDDKQHLAELFSPLSEEDLRVFRQNVKDVEVVQSWCDNLDYNEILPVIALVKDRAVGLVTLHFFHGARRHIGEVRIFLAKDFRKRGLILLLAAGQGALLTISAEGHDELAAVEALAAAYRVGRFRSTKVDCRDDFIFGGVDDRNIVIQPVSDIKTLAIPRQEQAATLELRIPSPTKWTAETPNLTVLTFGQGAKFTYRRSSPEGQA